VRTSRGGSGRGLPVGAGAERLSASYPAAPASVGAARAALAAFAARAGASKETIEAAVLAVSEAVTNVVMHAYRDAGRPGAVELEAATAGGELWVIVADDGGGLRARRDSPGLGLGLGLIAQVSQGVEIVNRSGGGLELRMRFALDPAAAAS
jgi:anti-sigma regulatory factor (Ser/Thr protein kinase)